VTRARSIGDPDPEAVHKHRETIEKPFSVLDAWLSSHDNLSGSSFSLAELCWMPYLEYLSRLAA
jgi:glutathione S-transferase